MKNMLKNIILSLIIIIFISVIFYLAGIKVFNINYPFKDFIITLIITICTFLLVIFLKNKFFQK